MAVVTKTRTYSNGGTLTASNYNDDRDEIISGVNNIVNAQVSSGAAIEWSKISKTGSSLADLTTRSIANLSDVSISGVAQGAVLYYSGSNWVHLAAGTNGQFLKSQGAAANPIWASPSSTTRYQLTDQATIAVDFSNGSHQYVTLGGNRTITLAGGVAGGKYVLELIQDGGGSRTVTWSTAKWPSGTAPTLTTTAAAKDFVGFIYDGTNYNGVAVSLDLR